MNIGSGEDFSIKQLAEMIKKSLNFNGKIIFNKKYPDGVKVRKVNSSINKKYRVATKNKIKLGLIKYCDYYLKTINAKRKFILTFLM